MLTTLWATPARAQMCGGASPYMLIVLDKSGSMNSSSKWTYAKSAISNLVNGNPSIWFGLMYFTSSCSNSVSVPCGASKGPSIISSLNSNSPGGGTDVGGALKSARSYLGGLPNTKSKFVLVITDGCTSTSCGHYQTEAQMLSNQGIKTYVVGFGTGVCPSQLSAMAAAGGTNSYYQANNSTALNAALKNIAGQVSCCGNGKLDAGEKCDIAAPAGSANACPSSCNDGDTCTLDQMFGSQCQTECLNTPITGAANGDGCCPPGANSTTDTDCPKACGNGVWETGEKCDPGVTSGGGKCPTPADCMDGNVCTKDTVKGTGCNQECDNPALKPSTSGTDGCCPPGATSVTDSDCPAACGNGIKEAGESCDPGITSGPGKCKTAADCDDKNTCTKDALVGSACNLSCKNTAISANPTKKDLCCPKGATSLTDKDCPVACGNGVLELGETCDTGINTGPGRCPSVSKCDDGDICTKDALIGSACKVKCQNEKLQADATKKDNCCPKGHSSTTDLDCPKACGPDHLTNCIDLCKGVSCPVGYYCMKGKCVPWPKDLGAPNEDGGPIPTWDSGKPKPVKDTGGTLPKGDAGKLPLPPGWDSKPPVGGDSSWIYSEGGLINKNAPPADFRNVDGCACQTGGSAQGLPLLLGLGLLLLAARRRK